MSADDVDKVVRFGLGPRYAFMGPLETAHLNAEGKCARNRLWILKLRVTRYILMKFVSDQNTLQGVE